MTISRDEALRLAKEAGARIDACSNESWDVLHIVQMDLPTLERLIRLARQPDTEVVRDAARYRWLRDKSDVGSAAGPMPFWANKWGEPRARLLHDDLDAAIDAILAARQEKPE